MSFEAHENKCLIDSQPTAYPIFCVTHTHSANHIEKTFDAISFYLLKTVTFQLQGGGGGGGFSPHNGISQRSLSNLFIRVSLQNKVALPCRPRSASIHKYIHN